MSSDVQTGKYAILPGKQLCGVGYALSACASRQKKRIIDGSFVGDHDLLCRTSLRPFDSIEFCAAKGQGRSAAFLRRFYKHIGLCIGRAGCTGLDILVIDPYTVRHIAVHRGIDRIPQFKGRIIRRGILPRRIMDRPGDDLVRQSALFAELRFRHDRLVFRITEAELRIVFKFHRVEVAVPFHGYFVHRHIGRPDAVQIKIGAFQISIFG